MSPAPVSVVVCRGCCCGSDKHPGTDHDGQVAVLRAVAGRCWTVDCLGPCERSNVVVVRGPAGRRWFGDVLDAEVTDALVAWIAAGAGPPVPGALAGREFRPDDGPSVLGVHRALGADGLADLLEAGVATGTWRIGRQGAAVELTLGGASVERLGRVVTAVGAGAAVRFAVREDTGVFDFGPGGAPALVVLAVPSPPLRAEGPAAVGPDTGAIRPEDRAAVLVELAGGFAARTADPVLGARLAALAGAGALTEVPEVLAAPAVDRVVRHALGRAEVLGGDHAGGRADLDPGHLELDRTLPARLLLPEGWTAVAMWRPPAQPTED